MTRARLISLLGLLATISVALVGIAGPSQAAGPVTPAIGLPGSQTAVKDDDTLRLGGTVGPNAQSVISASLKVFGPNGNQIGPTIDRTSKTSVSQGAIVGGQYILDRNNFRNQPTDNYLDAHGGRLVFEVTVRFSDGPFTGSATVPIDLLAPVMDAASLRRTQGGQAREIEVKFSEPVIHPDGNDLPSDWRIQDQNTAQIYPVDSVCCHNLSDRRILTLTTDANEDSVLLVDFTPTQVGRNDYVDQAGNFLGTRQGPNGNECQCRLATDDIPPALPTIEQIDGENGANAVGNDPTPVVRVGNVNNGNTAQVYLETNPGANPSWSPLDDQLVGQGTADATRRADVTISELGGDGPYILWGVAKDAAGNSSRDGARGDYRLDRVVPRGLAAGTNGNTVDVFLTEPIYNGRIPANWTVTPPGLPPQTVTGNDGTDHRLLTLPAGQSADCNTTTGICPNVNYSGTDATDRAGNTMPNFTLTTQNALAPFARITKPEGEVWEKAASYTIQGTVANNGSSISVFTDNNDDEVADTPGSPLRTAPVSNGAFSVDVPLATGARVENNFVVTATRTDINPARTGPYVDVPMIIQDNIDPAVSVQAPVAGAQVPGGGTVKVRWQASDAGSSSLIGSPVSTSFGTEPIFVEYSTDGGTTWHPAVNAFEGEASREANDGEMDWLVPDDVNTTNAVIRVTAEDRALRKGAAQSGIFTIDSDNPFFGAATKDTTHITVEFSEPVKGVVNALEWRIDGVPAKSTSPSGNQTTPISSLTLETVAPFGTSAEPQVVYTALSPPTQLTDGAGNEIAPTSARAADGIAPPRPSVADPTIPVLVGQDTYHIKGAAEAGSLVTVYRDVNKDTTVDAGDVEVGSQQLASGVGAYDVAATLIDGANELLVTAKDSGGNESPAADVPTITADLVPPVVTILHPTGGEVLGGGDSNFTVHWAAFDANLVSNSIKIEYSTDNGATWRVVGENEANDGEFSFPIPNEAVKAARFRVSASDLYGRVGSATSGPFEILVCEIIGTNGNDVLVGTDRGETICSYDGDDLVNAKGGNDTVLSGDGKKRVDAGSGNDQVEGGRADDLIRGGSGDDDLNAEDGNDKVFGDEGKDLLAGDNGNDSLRGGSGNDRALGQAGNDRLIGDSGSDSLNGGEGDDSATGGTGNDTVLGEDGNDRLQGSTGDDSLKGGDGNDKLVGSANDDRLDGGKGRDRLTGGSGNDRLSGGSGKDKCNPGSGANVVAKSC